MIKEYEVRPYQPGDEEEIVELLELVFDVWPHFDLKCTPLEYWKWKYQENPMKKNFITVAINGGKIIGCSHAIPIRMKIGDAVFLCSFGIDLAVHPDFRRMGISNKMHELREELRKKSDIIFAPIESGVPILIKHYSKIYPRFPHDKMLFVRIHDVDLHLRIIQSENTWVKKYGFLLLKLFNRIKNVLSVSSPSGKAFNISEIQSFDDRINKFWDEIKDHYTFAVERKRDYLNWRYSDPRGGNYLIKQIEEDGRILGFSVLRINRYMENYPMGYVVDLLTFPDRLDVAEAFVADAIDYFDHNDINIIKCLIVENHPHEGIFKKHGFLYSRERHVMFYTIFTPIGDELIKVKKVTGNRIHLSYGDRDDI